MKLLQKLAALASAGPLFAVLLAAALAGLLPTRAAAQGFGGASRTEVILHRKLPPTVTLSAASIKVDASPDSEMAQALSSALEAELVKDNRQLSIDNDHPQLTVHLTITTYAPPETQTVTKSGYQIGAKTPQNETYTRISSSLAVAFSVQDTVEHKVLDSDNVSARYVGDLTSTGDATNSSVLTGQVTSMFHKARNPKSDNGPQLSSSEVRGRLIAQVVLGIASHLVNTDEPVHVFLARGKLDEANKLASQDLWSKYLENLETMPPFNDAKDDSYRLYNIGVGYEASAYAAEDPQIASKFLDQAAINYGKAASAKPDEKYFIEPQARIETAIAHYKDLRDQLAKNPAGAGRGVSVGGGASGGGGNAKALNNNQVIALAKAGMDDDNLIDTIRNAPAVDFDLTVPGLLNLTQNGIKGPVLTAIKERARGPAPAAAAKPKAKTK